ncbi:MAG: MarR family transcriptional regulator [Nitrospinota bacterium]|nr:MarR family transcriptional regulator [Nitrospinota bacterium]
MVKVAIEECAERTIDSIHKIEDIFKLKPCKSVMRLDLNLPHLKVLRFIAHASQPQTISIIGNSLDISMAMMTRIIDKLENHKLVERDRDTTDRRIIRIKLSAKGKKLAKECNDCHKEHIINMLNGLTPKDREMFIAAMNTITEIISREGDKK